MGFVDGKGLKKVINRIKSEINNKINNIKVPETGQFEWTFKNDSTSPLYLNAYEICDYETKLSDLNIYFDHEYLPLLSKEYKLIINGYTLNGINWPSIFDMPWPNNEIPVFDEDKKYEIYIAGGRVVSVSDITPPVEEVTYIITGIQDVYAYLQIDTDGTPLEFYIDGNLKNIGERGVASTRDGSTITLTVKGDLTRIWEISSEDLQYIKVDCSKMKSNNFHKVTEGLKIDEIMYPQACSGKIYSPVYDFEADEVTLDFLYKNELDEPNFSFKVNNLYINNTINILYNSNTFHNTKLTNKQINKIISYSNNISYANDSFKTDYELKSKYMTLGTTENCIYVGDIFTDIQNTKLMFANVVLMRDSNIKNLKEGIIDCKNNSIIFDYGIDAKLYICNCNWETTNFNIIGNVTIYHSEDIPQSVIESSHNVTFIKVNDISEVPFQYAPVSWDDVKNYDDEGNVID